MDPTIIAAIIAAVTAIITALISRLPQLQVDKDGNCTGIWAKLFQKLSQWSRTVFIAFLAIILYNIFFGNDPPPAPPTEPPETSITTESTTAPVATTCAEEKEEPFILPGSTISFGTYEQDKNNDNGTEEIHWIVLKQDGDRVLLISQKGLAAEKYHQGNGPSDWETCTLRDWLNGTFYATAFTKEERNLIFETENVQHINEGYQLCEQGKNTFDHVFLLSIKEYEDYMYENGDISIEQCYGTPSKSIRSKLELVNNYSWWWLRTSAEDQEHAACANAYGPVNYKSHEIKAIGMVRPAIWVSIELWS